MSISSSLAHKYDEFEEFPQPSAPKSAYEELKEWCEKHLNDYDWYTCACTNHQVCLVLIDAHAKFLFNEDGSLYWIDN